MFCHFFFNSFFYVLVFYEYYFGCGLSQLRKSCIVQLHCQAIFLTFHHFIILNKKLKKERTYSKVYILNSTTRKCCPRCELGLQLVSTVVICTNSLPSDFRIKNKFYFKSSFFNFWNYPIRSNKKVEELHSTFVMDSPFDHLH